MSVDFPLAFPMGIDDSGNCLDYSTAMAPNFHQLLLGNSGTGKSYVIQKILANLAKERITSIVIDTQGDYKYEAFPESLKPFIDRSLIQTTLATTFSQNIMLNTPYLCSTPLWGTSKKYFYRTY